MDIKITSERKNPLLERREVEFVISYDKTAPPRKEVITKLAADMNVKDDLVVVEKMKTEFGTHIILGRAKVYGNAENLKAIEYDYIFERGKIGEGKPKKTDAKGAADKEAEAGMEKDAEKETEAGKKKDADKETEAGKEEGAGKKADKSSDVKTSPAETAGNESKTE